MARLAWFALALSACATTSDEWMGPVPSPDGVLFVNEVYPMLLRDCAFSDCHGAHERFFQVYGPGRSRLTAATKPDDPMNHPEVVHSYHRTRSMIATSAQVEQSLLLGKPLETAAGGQSHKGIDDFGRNLFVDTRDPKYQLLLRWALSRGVAPTPEQVAAASQAQSMAAP